jgi:exodeoxyribonuclease-3
MSLNIYSWNVNGIRAAAEKGFNDWFKNSKPDIACLQETKAQREQLKTELASPKDYHSDWNSAQKKGYSGVATFSRIKPIKVNYGLGIEEYDCEGRVIESWFDDFILFNIYFPNGGRDHSRVDFKLKFCDAVLERCEYLKKQDKNLIICGDYNTAHKEIDLKNPKANQNSTGFLPNERAWIDKFIQHGYVDTFRHFNQEPGQYTWWTYRFSAREKNIGWRIDYFFVNEKFLSSVKDAFILAEIKGSDHCPIGIEIELNDK